ncbi:MAG: class II aldolase/adducin family protein [candidate division Zixibacteria bacterium]|nr:class II aldolase/adducin family protein [candidate division Zixibacteria bacterium]
MITESEIRSEIIETGRLLYEKGFLAGAEGNISHRLGDDRIIITPSGVAKGRMKPEELVVVERFGELTRPDGIPSSELGMHLEVYDQRPDILACVHSHPPHSTACGVSGIDLADDVLPETLLYVGHIPLAPYAPPGTAAVAESIRPFLKGTGSANAILLKNHGLLTLGASLTEAYHRHEVVEALAKVLTISKSLGKVNRLPSDEIRRLKNLASKPK